MSCKDIRSSERIGRPEGFVFTASKVTFGLRTQTKTLCRLKQSVASETHEAADETAEVRHLKAPSALHLLCPAPLGFNTSSDCTWRSLMRLHNIESLGFSDGGDSRSLFSSSSFICSWFLLSFTSLSSNRSTLQVWWSSSVKSCCGNSSVAPVNVHSSEARDSHLKTQTQLQLHSFSSANEISSSVLLSCYILGHVTLRHIFIVIVHQSYYS